MLRLLVHADDFGLSHAVNQGIVQAFTQGMVRSCSLMASGSAVQDAYALARLYPNLDVGVHLTLTEELPVSSPQHLSSLLVDSGHFYPHALDVMKRLMTGRIQVDEVEREWRAQIEAVLSQGIAVSHLDGHQHVHLMPKLFKLTTRLAREYGIPAVRGPKHYAYGLGGQGLAGMVRDVQRQVLSALGRAGQRHLQGLTSAESMWGFHEGGRLSQDVLRRLLPLMPKTGTVELMCHPGIADATRYAQDAYPRELELQALTDLDVLAWLQANDVMLISYRDLALTS